MESPLIVTLKVDDLKNIINDCIAGALQRQSSPANDDDDTLLTREEVAKHFRVCPKTITAWTKAGFLKKETIGNRVFYKKGTVLKAFETTKKYNRK